MEMFINRLQRMSKHFRKWARRREISCFRLYDRDIPEFPYLIEIYQDAMLFFEYVRIPDYDPEKTKAKRDACLEAARAILEISPDKVYLKQREKKKGVSQYEKISENKNFIPVTEGGLTFYVNFSDYLDSGLFLDHRITRSMIREEANGKDFLNMFAYTGSFSVYAASGNAKTTTTVDMSKTYIEWARLNMKANGFTGPGHYYIQENYEVFLDEAKEESFDLAVVDPPTFSNSKKMHGTFDVQRDHGFLLSEIAKLMRKGGKIYFSTNFQKFKLYEHEIHHLSFEEITARTIPEDFRNKKIHKVFVLTKQ